MAHRSGFVALFVSQVVELSFQVAAVVAGVALPARKWHRPIFATDPSA